MRTGRLPPRPLLPLRVVLMFPLLPHLPLCRVWTFFSQLKPPPLPAPLAPGPEMPAAELSEAQKYLETGFSMTLVSGKDILDFWRMHEKEYPYLAKMARQYLGCPASSASVERIFSVAGQFFDDLRRKLDDKKLEELMWAAINKGNRRKE